VNTDGWLCGIAAIVLIVAVLIWAGGDSGS
jgi:hypothetical protein